MKCLDDTVDEAEWQDHLKAISICTHGHALYHSLSASALLSGRMWQGLSWFVQAKRTLYAKPVPVVYGYIYREREIENPDKALREKIKRETRRETESER